MLTSFVSTLFQQIVASPEPSPLFLGLFGSKIEAACVAVLVAIASYITAKAVRLRKFGPQRRVDDGWRKAMEDKLRTEVDALKASMQTVEGIARNAVARAEDAVEKVERVDDKVDNVQQYLHEISHGLRGEMQTMTRAIGNVEGSLDVLIRTIQEWRSRA